MKAYRDARTGYEVCQYTEDSARNAKLYFTTENFSADDRYFFFERTEAPETAQHGPQLHRADCATGEIVRLADAHYGSFAMHWQENYGVIAKDDGTIFRIDVESGAMTTLGRFPARSALQGHLTIANDGRVAGAVQLENKIYALVILDPGQEEAQVVFETDQRLGHTQICPTDSNLLFYVHETGGDALQRTWMFDVRHRMKRPYYVEHPNEWITHETWSADGESMAFMHIPGKIMLGDRDGRHFDVVFGSENRILHPGISRDRQWLCTDMLVPCEDGKVRWAVVLIHAATGESEILAFAPGDCATGMDHLHPSFNRAGDKILFSAPDERGFAQVCTVDLRPTRLKNAH